MTVNRYEGLAIAVALIVVGKLLIVFVRFVVGSGQ